MTKKKEIDYTKSVPTFIEVKKNEKAIIEEQLEVTFDNFRRNQLMEMYFVRRIVGLDGQPKKEAEFILAKVQGEMTNQKAYMDFLLEKLAE